MGLPSSWLTAGASLQEGPLTDEQRSRFGANDWLALQKQGQSAHNVLTGLWGSQNQLAGPQRNRRGEVTNRGNKPGVAYQPGLTGGLFDRIQQQAQREHPAWNKTYGVNQWQYGTWGGQGFGARDIEEARNRGASEYQLRQLYDRAGQLGIRRDTPAAQEIAANAPTPDWDYGSHGEWGFGMADIDAMGGDLEQIRGARDWARQNRLNIGEGVTDHIQGLESDRRFAEQQAFNQQLLQQQQQQAADAARIQQEMAAQAARVKGSSPTGVGGAASIKGSRLSITQSGGRRGTKRFARPTQYMNTLGMTSGGSTPAGKSPLNL